MRPRLSRWWMAAAVAAGVAAYSVLALRYYCLPKPAKAGPIIDYPSRLDLGNHEYGSEAVTQFSIANCGDSELVIDQIHTNCSCSGLEMDQDGVKKRVTELRLRASERVELSARVSVRGVPIGAQMLTVVHFRTNDPSSPEGQIQLFVRRVSGGIYFVTDSVVVGTVPVGSHVQQLIDVWDRSVTQRSIAGATSSDPKRVAVKVMPVTSSDVRDAWGGVRIARLEVSVNTATPGPVDATVEISVDRMVLRPDSLHVVGRVAPPIELFPSAIVLPRSSGGGPVSDARVVCQSNGDKPLDLELVSAPDSLSVTFLPQGSNHSRLLVIAWNTKKSSSLTSGRRLIVRLRARTADQDAVLELPVLIQPRGVSCGLTGAAGSLWPNYWSSSG